MEPARKTQKDIILQQIDRQIETIREAPKDKRQERYLEVLKVTRKYVEEND